MVQRLGRSTRLTVLAMLLAGAFGLGTKLQAQEELGRYQEVYGVTDERGQLVARFIRMSLETDAEEKSGDATIVRAPSGEIMLIDGGAP